MGKHYNEIRIDGVSYKGPPPLQICRDSSGNTWLCDRMSDTDLHYADHLYWDVVNMQSDHNF